MWYSELYRRHLLDMHLDDWHPNFLSAFSPETYVENLKLANINYAMLYLQSHAGLCYYPTESGVMHRALAADPAKMQRTAELCHEAGIRVCGYYSLIYNTREHDRHPSWRMLLASGRSQRDSGLDPAIKMDFTETKPIRYGFCCPNHPEYRQFVLTQIDEMLDYFPLDALFFDMPFWGHTCYCSHCQERYRAAFSTDLPVDPVVGSEEYRNLSLFKADQMGQFLRAVTEHIKHRCPEMPVEHNLACSIANNSFMGSWESVAEHSDYAGGDLYGNLYTHSFSCKYFRSLSKTQPFEQMFSRCKPNLNMHTLTKSIDEIKTAMALTMAHHGATLVIDAIDPIGTMDERVYDKIGTAFDFQRPYEPYFTGDMTEEFGIYYGMRSRTPGDHHNSRDCCCNLAQTLIRAHIPFGVTGSWASLHQYPILAAPMLSNLEEDTDRLVAYVENGGCLYISGCGNPELVRRLTGHQYQKQTEARNLYIAPAEDFRELFEPFNTTYPLPFNGFAPIVEPGENCTVIATITLPYTNPTEPRFASIHSDPPGIPTTIPVITKTPLGKGTVLWSALPLEVMEYEAYRRLLMRLFALLQNTVHSVSTDAPSNVELTIFETPETKTVHAVVLCEEEVSRPVCPFTVRVKTNHAPKDVVLLPDHAPIPYQWENGCTVFTTQTLHIFDMYQINL